MVGNHLKNQGTDFITMTHQCKQKPICDIKLCPVKFAMVEVNKLLDLGRSKIVTGKRLLHFAIAYFHP